MSDRQPRQVQRKLGEADANGNWQLGSPAPVSATDDKTQSVAGYKRRAPTAAAGPYSASNLQAAIHHNAAKETEEAVKAKPVDQGEQPVPKAEEQAAAAKTNENLATPVPQHVPLASIKSESPPDSNGKAEHPSKISWITLTRHPHAHARQAAVRRTATRRTTTGQTAARRRLSQSE